MQKKLTVALVALIAGVIAVGVWKFGFLDRQASSAKDTIKIGLLLPLTGGAASYGENSKKGATLALQAFATEHPELSIDLIVEDSRGEAAQGVKAAQKLVNIDQVSAVVGCVTSGVTLAVAPLMNERRIPIVSTGGSAPAIRDAGEFVFRTWPSDVYEAEAMARHLGERQIRRLAILRINNEYGLAMERALTQRLAPTTQVVATEGFEQGAREMRTQVLKIKDAQADALYFIGFPEAAVALAPSLSAVGLKVPLFATSAFEDPQIPEKTGGVLEGAVYTKPLAKSPAVEGFRRIYKERYGIDPGVTSDTAYDAAALVMRAIASVSAAKSPVTGEAIRDYLLQVKDYAGTSGTLSFDAAGDVVKPVGLFTLHAGRYEALAR